MPASPLSAAETKFPRRPDYIQLYPTFSCNQRCVFCFNRNLPALKAPSDLTPETGRLLFDLLSETGISEVDIMGGEPLLVTGMASLVRYAVEHGLRVNLSTNGSLTDALMAFTEVDPERLTIGFSLEGSTAELHRGQTGADHFQAVLRSISSLHKAGLIPLAKTVVNRETMSDIPRIASLLEDLGIRRYFLIHMDVLSPSPSQIRNSLSYPEFISFFGEIRQAFPAIEVDVVAASCFDRGSMPRNARCAGGLKKLAVSPDGSCYPCNLFMGVRSYGLGNILHDPWDLIWDNPLLHFFRGRAHNGCPNEACSNRTNCTGGCPAHGHHHFRNPAAPDIRCIRP